MDNYNQIVKVAGFIGDVHAEDDQIESSIAFFKYHGIKDIFCLGDFCDGYGDVNRIVSIVQDEGIKAVKGNHDIWCLEERMRDIKNSTSINQLSEKTACFIENLPKTDKVMTCAGEIIICHGILNNMMAKVMPDDYGYAIESNLDLQAFINGSYPDIMINGHTHRRMVKQIQGKLVINVGTLFREHSPCIATVDFLNKNICFYDVVSGIIEYEPEIINFSGKIIKAARI